MRGGARASRRMEGSVIRGARPRGPERLGAEGRAEGQGQRLRTPPPPATSTGGLADWGASVAPPGMGRAPGICSFNSAKQMSAGDPAGPGASAHNCSRFVVF